jgi:DNA repair exonuclease SbcCD ATPase subunit
MLVLRELNLQDFCQHREATYPFSPGTNGIVGPNGRGKSNLLNAIYFLITGQRLPKEGTLDEDIFHEADTAEVGLKFTLDGTEGTITRKIKAPWREDGVRDKVSTTASMKFGEGKPTRGVKNVTQQMSELTGLEPKLLSDHVFVGQDALKKLLFQPRAERLASFIELIPAVSQAELLRASLHAELARYPEIEMGVSLDTVQKSIAAVDAEVVALNKRDELLSSKLGEINYQDLVACINRHERAGEAKAEMGRHTAELTTAGSKLDDLTVRQAEVDTKYAGLQTDIDRLRSADEASRATLTNLEQARQVFDARVQATKVLTDIQARIAGLVDPEPVDCSALPGYEQRYNDTIAETTGLRKIITLLDGGTTTCPTCGNVFKDPGQTLADAKARVEQLSEPLAVVQREISRLREQQSTYQSACAVYRTTAEQLRTQLANQEKTLAGIPQVEEPNEEQITKLRSECKMYEDLQAEAKTLSEKSSEIASSIATKQADIEHLESQIASCREKIASAPTDEEHEAVIRTKDQYERTQGEQAETRGAVNAKRDELSRLREQEAQILDAAKKADSVRAYRGLLSRTREILHRDNLPAEALSIYTARFGEKLNKFLSMFGNPFAIKVDKDMGLTCIMPAGYPQPAYKLSGGQQAVLSVSARFTIHELFAKSLGLMVLDEPSQNLDKDNVQLLSELMEKIGQVSKQTSVQTIVVSHHVVEMRGSFDNVIDLT